MTRTTLFVAIFIAIVSILYLGYVRPVSSPSPTSEPVIAMHTLQTAVIQLNDLVQCVGSDTPSRGTLQQARDSALQLQLSAHEETAGKIFRDGLLPAMRLVAHDGTDCDLIDAAEGQLDSAQRLAHDVRSEIGLVLGHVRDAETSLLVELENARQEVRKHQDPRTRSGNKSIHAAHRAHVRRLDGCYTTLAHVEGQLATRQGSWATVGDALREMRSHTTDWRAHDDHRCLAEHVGYRLSRLLQAARPIIMLDG
ncbi:uncharacterized protein N0V89_011806 [Didymosphaeria variabile]|uniref:Uncharacterized protein n=1 Tax=Didymosphaeria variabile TaxID=1932322 RepID=A0A9W8XAG2_9PLEO|nr:uncharacterized protein N0V89_011806 [Didymosphaeria variabile]KAJ4345671.1 hypothetical protein N0V89_011806 [Didymosphaeria variabile]